MEKAQEAIEGARADLHRVEEELAKRPTKFQVAIALVLLAVVLIGFGIYVVTTNQEDDRQNRQIAVALNAANRVDIESKVESCRSGNNGRRAIQKLLDEAAAGGTSLDFEAVEGFATLLDPDTQQYLRNLQAASEAAGPGSFETAATNYRKTNPQVDCEALEAKLRKQLGKVEDKAGG